MVKLDRGDQVSTLEIDIEMPDAALTGDPAPAAPRRCRAAQASRGAR